MTIESINPLAIAEAAKRKGATFKGQSLSGADFGSYLNMFGAATGPAAATAGSMYGNTPAYVALNAAFSGMGQAASSLSSGGGGMGGMSYGASIGGGYAGAPYLAAGTGVSYKAGGYTGAGTLDPNSPVIPGTGVGPDGLSYGDMISTMNQNNLQLLELQAMMQNNMQMWNTKSNILSADHRARMAMIEKFTARG